MVPPTMVRARVQSILPNCRCRTDEMTALPAMWVASIPEAMYPGKPKTMRAGVTMYPPPTPMKPPTTPTVKPVSMRRKIGA